MNENDKLQNYSPEDVDKLIALTTNLYTENDNLRQEIMEQQQQIQTISSEKQKLLKQVQEQSLQIQQQAEILLKQKNNSQQEQKKIIAQIKAEAEESANKKRDEEIKKAEERFKRDYERRTEDLERKIANQDEYIRNQAETLNSKNKAAYGVVFIMLIIYSALITLATAVRSKEFIADVKTVGTKILNLYGSLSITISKAATRLLKLESEPISYHGKIIQLNLMAAIISYFIIFVIVLILLILAIKLMVKLYSEHCNDNISIIAAMIILISGVWFVDVIKFNVVLFMVAAYVVYIIIRCLIDSYHEYKEERKSVSSDIIVLLLVTVVIILMFLGMFGWAIPKK